ncbi:hypothetical protein PUN28_004092 [Cardiocondyla obscurior]|uniref:Uncharacterized protein n=1 Tax=Cardiocondyla obscurior TaxID=286306 RepID=A0AAW2GPI2_9HYME
MHFYSTVKKKIHRTSPSEFVNLRLPRFTDSRGRNLFNYFILLLFFFFFYYFSSLAKPLEMPVFNFYYGFVFIDVSLSYQSEF